MSKQGKRKATGKTETSKPSVLIQVAHRSGDYEPLMTSTASTAGGASTSYRTNVAATAERSQRYANIDSVLVPFKYSGSNKSNMNVRDAVELCQKAYYGFAIFRNTIDLMTEFSVGNIFLRGGSKKSRDFFRAWLSKIGINGFQDKFYREYYRSGSVFTYRFDGEVQKEDLDKITQTFGGEIAEAAKDASFIPVRYIVLNPADIESGGSLSFARASYFKALTGYELERLKKPRTDEDREMRDSLPDEVKKALGQQGNIAILLPLDDQKIIAVFYKKQDYEPFAIPMGYPVLDDLNWKAEMKKMDMAITRTLQQAILLITLGESPKDGGLGVNPKHLEAMQHFFENESVARVLIADYTTKASFVIPDVADLLDPKKYAQVDKDIREGLNNVLMGGEGEKFATASVKIDIFVERLNKARDAFLSEFLLPEIKRVAKSIGLKNYPAPYFREIDLKNSLEFAKIYSRLVELGVLTAEEGLEALQNGKLPSAEESAEHQAEYRKLKDKGFYEPLVGGPFSQMQVQKETLKGQVKIAEQSQQHDAKMKTKELKHAAENPQPVAPQIHVNAVPGPAGRPTGTKQKQSGKKKVTRVGGSEDESGYSLTKIKDILVKSNDLHAKAEQFLKGKYSLEALSEEQKNVANSVAELIVSNENPEDWESKIVDYFDSPIDKNEERVEEILALAYEHQVDSFLASVLYHSRK